MARKAVPTADKFAGKANQGRRGRRRCVEEGGSASEGWWGPGGAGRLDGAGSRWAGNRGGGGGAEFPAELEVGDKVRDLFANS